MEGYRNEKASCYQEAYLFYYSSLTAQTAKLSPQPQLRLALGLLK